MIFLLQKVSGSYDLYILIYSVIENRLISRRLLFYLGLGLFDLVGVIGCRHNRLFSVHP